MDEGGRRGRSRQSARRLELSLPTDARGSAPPTAPPPAASAGKTIREKQLASASPNEEIRDKLFLIVLLIIVHVRVRVGPRKVDSGVKLSHSVTHLGKPRPR